MKTLVLCVDRDDDIGTKTSFKGPIIGRDQNIQAAVALGVSDPEDPDTNAILAAVSIYDALSKTPEREVEIATICGNTNVGVISDSILASQIEDVIRAVGPDNAILVSDGVEDEYIFPIVSSRLKINSVKRVLIKQSQTIESTYYTLLKTFQNERMRKKLITPIGLALLIVGLFAMIPTIFSLAFGGVKAIGGLSTFGLAMTAAVLGLYLLWYACKLGEKLSAGVKRLKYAILTAKLTFFFSIAAVVILLTGFLIAYNATSATSDYTDFQTKLLVFGNKILIWLIIGAWVYFAGNSIDTYLRRGRMHKSFYMVTISLIALGLIMYAALGSIQVALGTENIGALQILIYSCIFSGLAIAVIGALLHHAIKVGLEKEARWRR